MVKKLCALILAHHSPELLGRLLRRLDGFGVQSLVHIDRRVDIAAFLTPCAAFRDALIPERVEINWGGFSVIEATLNLIRTGLAASDATHFLLLSGDTYPVRPRTEFLDYLLSAGSHIDIRAVASTEKTYERIAHVYLPDSRIGTFLQRTADPSLGRYLTPELVGELDVIERAVELKSRAFPWRYAKGSQWWCMTRSAIESCLDLIAAHAEFVTWFKYSSVPDESFFQSLMLNFSNEPVITEPPVFTLWHLNPRPYMFKHPKDLELLGKCKTVLARKFAMDATALLNLLDGTPD